jgi:hypothetical protein
MTPIFQYYQFPREVWSGKEAAWNAGVTQADAEFKKLMVRGEWEEGEQREGEERGADACRHCFRFVLSQHNICCQNWLV